jgi:small subunit ribosomal protein S21
MEGSGVTGRTLDSRPAVTAADRRLQLPTREFPQYRRARMARLCKNLQNPTLKKTGYRARFLSYPDICPVGKVWRCSSPVAEIRVQEGEPLENALRRFKRKVQTEDIIKEVKRHSFYLKPGEKRRAKEALARKRNRKKIRKEQD